MTDPIPSLLEQVTRLDKEATKGPWKVMNDPDKLHQVWTERLYQLDALLARTCFAPSSRANADLIATYRTAAPLLATEVMRLRAELEAERRKVEVVVGDFLKKAEVYGLAGATNHPAVKCEVKGLTLGDFYALAALTPTERGDGE